MEKNKNECKLKIRKGFGERRMRLNLGLDEVEGSVMWSVRYGLDGLCLGIYIGVGRNVGNPDSSWNNQ